MKFAKGPLFALLSSSNHSGLMRLNRAQVQSPLVWIQNHPPGIDMLIPSIQSQRQSPDTRHSLSAADGRSQFVAPILFNSAYAKASQPSPNSSSVP